jgi:hypothetical protein
MRGIELWVAVGLVALVSACGPPAKSVPPMQVDGALLQAARALQVPPPDRARVIIMSGSTMKYVATGSSYLGPHYIPGEILVNGTKIGTLNGLEAMVFDVRPGQYTLQWTAYRKSGAVDLKYSIPLLRNLTGGSLALLATAIGAESGALVSMMRYSLGPPSTADGLTTDRGDRTFGIAADYMVVRPQDCPPTICL